MRKGLVFADGGLVVELPDADEPGGALGLVREDGQATVDLHRVGGDELGGKPLGQRLGDGRLARGGRPEDGEDGHPRRDARTWSSALSSTPTEARNSRALPCCRSSSTRTSCIVCAEMTESSFRLRRSAASGASAIQGSSRRRPAYGALGIVLGDGLHGHARQAKEQGGNQSRAVDAARAVDQDGALRRVRDLSYSPSEVPLEAVEQEEVVPTPPGHGLVDVREQLVDLQDALGVEQRDSDEFDRRFVGRILVA